MGKKTKSKQPKAVPEAEIDLDSEPGMDMTMMEDLESFIQGQEVEINSTENEQVDMDENNEEEEDEDDEEAAAELAAYMALQREKGLLNEEEKTYINNTIGLETRLKDIQLIHPQTQKPLPFIETLCINGTQPLDLQPEDIHDDLKREMAIYKQTLLAASKARHQIVNVLKLPFDRPDDYFAEMVKTDAHMARIRTRLIQERESMKASEEAKKLREAKKFGKKVQVSKLLEREKEKQSTLAKLKELRKKKKGSANSSLEGEDGFDIEVESAMADSKSNSRSGRHPQGHDGKSKKRMGKDKKFGFGGPKRFGKSNTKESTDDFNYSVKKMKRPFNGVSGGKAGGGKVQKGKPTRPGKARRAQAKGRK